jgi:hypothetical protein
MNIFKEKGFEMNLYLNLECGCKGSMMGATKFKFEIQRKKIQVLQKWPNKIVITIHE